MYDHGDQHSLSINIQSEQRLAGDDTHAVNVLSRGAYDGELMGRFHLHLCGYEDLGRVTGNGTIAQRVL